MPTFSLNKKIENIVVNIGAAKEILTTPFDYYVHDRKSTYGHKHIQKS